MNGVILLGLAILCEVIGTTALRLSNGFTRWEFGIIVVVGYGAAFYLLSQALKEIPLGTAYAVWAGLGTALIAVIGVFAFQEIVNLWRVLGIALIIAGVMILNLLGGATH